MSLAETSSSDIEYPFLLAYAAIPFAGLVTLNLWNSGNTVEVKLRAVSVAMAFIAVPAMASFLWYWFKRREDLPYIPAWNLKQDSPGMWVITGVLGALTIGCMFSWFSWVLVGVVAQYVTGDVSRVTAKVISTTIHHERSRTCDVTAEFSVGWNDHLKFCVVPRGYNGYGALTKQPLQDGQNVILLIEDNILGKVVVGLEGTSAHGT